MKKSVGLLMITAMSTASFGLTLHSMGKTELAKAFENKTATSISIVKLDNKMIQNTITVFLDGKGHISGVMAQKPNNEPQKDQGTYLIKPDGAMYITWQHWHHATPIQAYFFDTKNAYVVIDSNPVFHTVFLKSEMKTGDHL